MPSHAATVISPMIRHEDCSVTTSVGQTFLILAALGSQLPCHWCGGKIDAWPALVTLLTERSDLWHGAGFAGSQSIQVIRKVKKNALFELDLAPDGVPENALLHRVISTPQNAPNFVVMSPVVQSLGRPLIGNRLSFWPTDLGLPLSENQGDWTECDVAFFVIWAEQGNELGPWSLLQSALLAFYDDDLQRAILDSLNAIDLVLKQVLQAVLSDESYTVERFGSVTDRVAVLRLVLEARGEPALHPRLLPLISSLNKTRNRGGVAHPGEFTSDMSEVANFLAAALASTAYLTKYSVY